MLKVSVQQTKTADLRDFISVLPRGPLVFTGGGGR